MCKPVRIGLSRSWSATGGSATTDLIIVIGLFGVAVAIWFLQIGGDEGLSDALLYLGRRLRYIGGLGP